MDNRDGSMDTDFNHNSSKYLTIWFTKDIC
jgi:hypothetical protein